MNDLIKIDYENNTIDARELWKFLGSSRQFGNWITERIEKYEFVEGEDFLTNLLKSGGRPSKEYLIKIDMAKELAMIENNSKGREIRRYFIQCEKKLKELVSTPPPELTTIQILEMALEAEKKLLEQAPKIEVYEKFIEAKNAISMGDFAKTLGTGRNKLFKKLRKMGILKSDNIPYQRFIDSGYFDVKIRPAGNGINNSVTLVTPIGAKYLGERI